MIHPTIHKRRTPVGIADLPLPAPGPVKTLKDLPPEVVAELKAKYEKPPLPCTCSHALGYRRTHQAPCALAHNKSSSGRGRRIKLRKKRVANVVDEKGRVDIYHSGMLYLAVNNME